MNKQLIVMVGPSGAGKSTMAKFIVASQNGGNEPFTYINQDSQGREHLHLFDLAILAGENVIVDRMGFTKNQRARYIDIAKANGYNTKIIVLHESYATCLERCINRQDHETIKEEKAARSALNMFFSKYERVEDSEADVVERHWPNGVKPLAIIVDLDGTLCNMEHRLHFVNLEEGQKKNWKDFFDNMSKDEVNVWCKDIILSLYEETKIVLCSGRPDNYRMATENWLANNEIPYHALYMRNRADQRQDNITKEVILDFELLSRYSPHFFIDDRSQVVEMYRKRGFTVLQCAKGNF
jgi:predicted kinase